MAEHNDAPDMRRLISDLGAQMAAALTVPVSRPPAEGVAFRGVAVLGMGGSGIGAAVLADMLRATCPVPFAAVSDQVLPGWVGEGCLVVASSYSGNTEETLAALDEAEKRGCDLAAVTSGGTLGTRAEKGGWPTVIMPGGNPPRSQFGRSFLGLCALMNAFGLVTDGDWADIQAAVAGLDGASAAERGESLALAVEGKNIYLYADTPMRGLLTRWRQQLNENSKLLANVEVFPEMNHNELVGWETGDEQCVAVLVRTPDDHVRTSLRMDITSEVFQEQGADVVVVEPDGGTPWARLLDAVWVGDWMSLVLAERGGFDPVDIRFIDHLKNTLAKHE
ncbi:MAG: bifunctional phosphoglucose/phosphomannose isomerase [Flavobacteriales bacterium]